MLSPHASVRRADPPRVRQSLSLALSLCVSAMAFVTPGVALATNLAPNGTIDLPIGNVTITAGETVNFQGTATDPDGPLPFKFKWDMGGGATDRISEDPGYVAFTTPGVYTISFRVTDALGLADPTLDTRVITVIAPVAPLADELHWSIMGQSAATFDWRGGSNTIHYGTTTSYGQTALGLPPDPMPFSSGGPFREARLSGLAENTTYHYSIGGAPDHTFRTPPPHGGTGFSIVVQGDIGSSVYARVAPTQSRLATLNPDFVLMIGDITYANINGIAQIDRHYNDMMVWSRSAAYMPAWGNHEYETPDSDDFRNYKGRHDLPNPQTSPNAPSLGCCGEDWYWFDYGNVRFIAYPEPYPGAVNEWATHAGPLMDVAQADPAIDFIVTFGHRPAFSSGNHPGESTLRNALAALAVGHPKYVLNLNGHSHDYERSYPQVGVTHVTAGTGGASLENTGIPACDWVGGCPAPPWSAYRAMHHVILKLHFTATTIEGTAYCGPAEITRDDMVCQEGTILDTFTIQPTLGLGPAGAPSPPAARAWVWPTVVQSSGTLSFVSTRDGPATVELFDLAGRRVAEVMDARALKSGRHDVTIGDPYSNTGQLPGGMYLYRVRLGEGVLRGRFLIAR